MRSLKLWGSEVESDPPTVDHEEAMARGGMGKLTKYIVNARVSQYHNTFSMPF